MPPKKAAAEPQNPFSLEGKGKGADKKPVLARLWTEEEQAKQLEGFMEIPRAHWEMLAYGDFIHYYDVEGAYKYGGYITNNPSIQSVGGVDKKVVWLTLSITARGAANTRWCVQYDAIDRIYAKPSATELVMMDSLRELATGLNANIKKLADYTLELERRVAYLEGGRSK